MRVVLDTNVIVSGLLCPHSVPAEVIYLIACGRLEPCYDTRIITEYRDVLCRKEFSFCKEEVEYVLDEMKSHGYVVAAEPLSSGLPDSTDEPFLEVAIAANAEYLITGNKKHFPLRKSRGIPVVSPAEFLKIYRKN